MGKSYNYNSSSKKYVSEKRRRAFREKEKEADKDREAEDNSWKETDKLLLRKDQRNAEKQSKKENLQNRKADDEAFLQKETKKLDEEIRAKENSFLIRKRLKNLNFTPDNPWRSEIAVKANPSKIIGNNVTMPMPLEENLNRNFRVYGENLSATPTPDARPKKKKRRQIPKCVLYPPE